MDSAAVYLAPVILAGLLAIFVRFNGRRPPVPLPPGPRGLPFIGNALNMPSSCPWETFSDWGKRWGAMTHITLFGQHYLVVNSLDTAIKMLEAKSTIYSDRPSFPMLGEMMGWKDGVAVARYGERLRALRRLLYQAMGTPASAMKRIPVIEREVHRFLQRLLDTPDQFVKNLRGAVNAITLDFAYGYKAYDLDDPLVQLTELASEQFARASIPGAFVVDTFAILYCDMCRTGSRGPAGNSWDVSGEQMCELLSTRHLSSFGVEGRSVSQYLRLRTKTLRKVWTEEEEDLVKWAANAITIGGTDTTISTLTTFFLAMTMYPEAQKKAQEEIDTVVGAHRLPTIDDRDRLPYVNGLLKEVLRWGPATPLAGPHRLTRDDEQDGYFIPEGTVVIVNVWGLMRDESLYSNPLIFNPERFVASETKSAEIDPRICFGFGRRFCPGIRVAEGSLFLFFAMTLATYQISKAVDESGAVLEPTAQYTSRLMRHPMPFPCTIKPRSEKAMAFIKSLHVSDSE
ncbi:cytochrome P450 [Lactarius psammicola]|nr:cytochrome P450 [Lactarius psammicola]